MPNNVELSARWQRHNLDCGGMRRASLRGRQNLNKRFKLAAAFYNLSQLMRRLFGIGTPKQFEAMGAGQLALLLHLFLSGQSMNGNWRQSVRKWIERLLLFDEVNLAVERASLN